MFADDTDFRESREQVEENLETWRYVLQMKMKLTQSTETEYVCQ